MCIADFGRFDGAEAPFPVAKSRYFSGSGAWISGVDGAEAPFPMGEDLVSEALLQRRITSYYL